MKNSNAEPVGVLVSAPRYFEVKDVKNEFMKGQLGAVDVKKARAQWDALVATFKKIGLQVEFLEPEKGFEDMVFTANPTFVGVDSDGVRTVVLAKMRYPSRRDEVCFQERWFEEKDYEILETPAHIERYEGGGDTVWHPGKRMIWGAVGPRSEEKVYPWLEEVFGAKVKVLRLHTQRFYHLDTCFCPLGVNALMYVPEAFDRSTQEMIEREFSQVIRLGAEEASGFAANALVWRGKVVIQKGMPKLEDKLRALSLEVFPVDTSEFMKSGGSVFCMKQWVF